MASKNKRYILYLTSNELWHYNRWTDYYSQYTSKDSWRVRLMTREELITYFACRFNNEKDLEKYLVDDCKIGLPKYEFIHKSAPNSSIKTSEKIYNTWYCIKVVNNGEETNIDYKALLKEIKKKILKLKK